MQIVRGGKVSQLADFSVIREKTFAIVLQFKTPYNKKDKYSLENLHDWRLIRENRKSFPPRTICIIRYYDWLNKFYNFCMAAVVSIVSRRSLIIETCSRSQPSKGMLLLCKP